MKIGITSDGYPVRRNILNKVSGAEYVLLRRNNNLFHTLATLRKLLLRKKTDTEGKYFFWQKPKIDVLHLYNDINYSSQKWVASFETLVPRFAETKNDHQKTEPSHKRNKKTENGLKQISKKNCLGIISISEASAQIQLELLKNYPEYENQVKAKLSVIHPAQELIPRNLKEFYRTVEKPVFIFVGTQFHLKGGMEMYEVLKKLKENHDFKLVIVSAFKTDHYVTKVTEEEAKKTCETLKQEDWIDIYENIQNEKVLELIKSSHVGLLPTWSDTYGFSVLEMQAAGVPVITTDIRALPEINNNDCGWLVQLPQNRLKQALYFTEEQKNALRETLKTQLEAVLTDILQDKNQILAKAEKSVERILKYHGPAEVEKKLREVYQSFKDLESLKD